jgi:hypothetical protein
MALVGLRIGATRSFQSKTDPAKGTEEATTFHLKTLSSRVHMDLRDRATKFVPNPETPDTMAAEWRPNLIAHDTVRFGLGGWENFTDEDGNDLPFDTVKRVVGNATYECVSDDCMDYLNPELIRELSDAINAANELSEEEAKNSD